MDTRQILRSIHPECVQSSAANQPISDEISYNINSKDAKGFLFDIVVVRLDIPNKSIDKSTKLQVDANFYGRNLSITSSRIDVFDFKPDRSIEIFANPSQLVEQLAKSPLALKVTDDADVIGYGYVEWPKDFLSTLAECEGEIINTFEIEITKCDGTKVGTIQILVRLQPKCTEFEKANSVDGKLHTLNKNIEPNDVIFLVNEPKTDCCCSQIGIIPTSESNQDLHAKCLDLSNLQAVSIPNTINADITVPSDMKWKRIQAIINQCKKLANTKNNQFRRKRDGDVLYAVPTDECLTIKILPSSSDHCGVIGSCLSQSTAFSNKNIKITHAEGPPALMTSEPQTFRNCPLCKENMDYLPKLAACPKCCYKPMPYFEEKIYDASQSADQILTEFHKNVEMEDISGSETNLKDPHKSRCTCKCDSNKPCGHCRIRKLCENWFQPAAARLEREDVCEPKPSDLYCVSSSDNRPFLTKVLSELKDLYDVEDAKPKVFKVDEGCGRKFKKKPAAVKHCPVKNENKTKIDNNAAGNVKERSSAEKATKKRKRPLKPGSGRAIRSRLYDYQYAGRRPPNYFGHKEHLDISAGCKNVPANMGWLWNINKSSKWKPGAIRKSIKELMRYFLKDFPADTLLVSRYASRKALKSGSTTDRTVQTLEQKPTLHIQKKNGEYIITMRPLKCRELLKDSADPYENMKPIQFRIVKDPRLNIIRNLKTSLKSMGFKKCTCHRPITYCYCRSLLDKNRLQYQCVKECCKRQIEPCCDTLVLSDTSDSEAEFDFGVTPPVGLIKPENLITLDVVNVGTQYDELDWNSTPLFPKPTSNNIEVYRCAVLEDKAKSVLGRSNGDKGVKSGELVSGRSLFEKQSNKKDGAVAKGAAIRSGNAGAKGGGDGIVIKATTPKKNVIANDFSGKSADRGALGVFRDTPRVRAISSSGAIGRNNASRAPISKAVAFRGAAGATAIGVTKRLSGARDEGPNRGIAASSGPSGARIQVSGTKTVGVKSPRSTPSKNITENIPRQKINMLKYMFERKKRMLKISKADAAKDRQAQMNLLKGVNPPLLCMVDRLGKPVDPCAPCQPRGDYRIC